MSIPTTSTPPVLKFTIERPSLWELVVTNLPAPVTKVSLTPDGLYILTASGRWDLIPWEEIAGLVADQSAIRLTNQLTTENRLKIISNMRGRAGIRIVGDDTDTPLPVADVTAKTCDNALW